MANGTPDYYRVTVSTGFTAYNELFLPDADRSYIVSAAIYNAPDILANGKTFKDLCATAEPKFPVEVP